MDIAYKNTFCFLLSLLLVVSGVASSMPLQDSLLTTIDGLVGAGNNPRDIDAYSAAIAKLVALDKLHQPFGATLTKRLALNETRVRMGKQARVSELAVSMAFNRIAETVDASPRVNVATVHAFRTMLAPHAPHLITVADTPDNCNPGEALFLIYIMIANDGTIKQVSQNDGQQLQANSVRVAVKPERQPLAMKAMVAKFVEGKQDVELLRRLESVLSLLRL